MNTTRERKLLCLRVVKWKPGQQKSNNNEPLSITFYRLMMVGNGKGTTEIKIKAIHFPAKAAQRWWKGVNVNSIGLCRQQIWKLSGTFELNSAEIQAFRLRTFGNKSSQSWAPTQYWCLPNTTPKFLGSLIKMKFITTSFLPK